MSTDWTHFLGSQGLVADGSHFGDPSAELRAARDNEVCSPLLDFGLIRASGEEAADFLHKLLTNDINGIDADTARFAGFCTPKGRLLSTFLIWRDGEDLLLMLPADNHAAMLKKLSMYVLRSKVKLTDATAECALIAVAAGAASPAPSLVGDAGELPAFGAVELPCGKLIRLDSRRWLIAASPEVAAGIWPRLTQSARPVGSAAWRWLEIQAGQPRVVAATQEAFVPQMLNMETPAVAGVSFTKGCYPGQEIVARTQYLGKVKRRMFLAHLAQAANPGAPLFAPEAGEQSCGAVVSIADAPDGGFDALVCVLATAAEAGEVHVDSPSGPMLRFSALPYALDG